MNEWYGIFHLLVHYSFKEFAMAFEVISFLFVNNIRKVNWLLLSNIHKKSAD